MVRSCPLAAVAVVATILYLPICDGQAAESTSLKTGSRLLVEVAAPPTTMNRIAADRIGDLAAGPVDVIHGRVPDDQRAGYRAVIVLGSPGDRDDLTAAWGDGGCDDPDAYLVKTLATDPPVVAADGIGPRGTLYAAYRLADLLAAGEDLASLDLRFTPRVPHRLAFLTAGSHAGEFFRPMLFLDALEELPRYGFSGVLLLPSAFHGTAAGREPLPLAIRDGHVVALYPRIDEWRRVLERIDAFGLEITVCWPALVPPGYSPDDARAYLAGSKDLPGYEEAIARHQRELLAELFRELPQIDGLLFHSLETISHASDDGEYGRAVRIFPLADAETGPRVFRAYLTAIDAACREHGKRLAFWTHASGIRGSGIRRMRELLFEHPGVTIVEDHYWPNAGWPTLPVMGYLPEDVRRTIHRRNPFGMFLITTDGEYYGAGSLPTAYPDPHFRAAREAADRGAEMVLVRVGHQDRTRFGTLFHFGEIVPLAAAAALWDPRPELDELWQSWARWRYGPAAAPAVVRALKQCETILTEGFTLEGVPLLDHSGVSFSAWQPKDQSGHSRFRLFAHPGVPLVGDVRYESLRHDQFMPWQTGAKAVPSEEFRARQQRAVAAADAALAAIEEVRGQLKPEDYAHLRGAFEDAKWVLGALARLGEAAHATHAVQSAAKPDPAARARFERAVAELEAYAQTVSGRRGPDFLRPSHFVTARIGGRTYRAPPLPLVLKGLAAEYRQSVGELCGRPDR